MSKPLPTVVPSDDYAVVVDGETFHPHEGESVTLFVGLSVAALTAINRLMSLGTQLAAIEGEPDQLAQTTALLDTTYQQVCEMLAPRIVAWTWTDLAGRPLPQPDGTAGPLQALDASEVNWLIGALKGETAGARKNGSRPSPTTSSATRPQPSQTSRSVGRSRPKGF